MGCCCNNTKDDKNQSPDCMASKSTVVTTPEGEDVEVNFNMGTGEVTYGKKTGCCSDKSDGTSSGGAVVQSRDESGLIFVTVQSRKAPSPKRTEEEW